MATETPLIHHYKSWHHVETVLETRYKPMCECVSAPMRNTTALDFIQAWISKPTDRDYTWKPSQLLQSSSVVFENSSISLEEGPRFCSAQSQCTSLSTSAPRKSMLHFPTLFQALNVAEEGCLHFQWQRGCAAMLLCMGNLQCSGSLPALRFLWSWLMWKQSWASHWRKVTLTRWELKFPSWRSCAVHTCRLAGGLLRCHIPPACTPARLWHNRAPKPALHQRCLTFSWNQRAWTDVSKYISSL